MQPRRFLRVGAILIVGGLLLFFALGLQHPSTAPPWNSPAAFREYAASHLWITIHLAEYVGFLLILGGLVILQRALLQDGGTAAGWASLGYAATVASMAVITLLQAVDGVALKKMVDVWVAAPPAEREAAFRAAEAVRWIEIGINALFRIMFGLAGLATALGLAVSLLRPRWFGWIGVALAVLTAAGGFVTAFRGFSPQASQFGAFFLLFLVWVAVLAVRMWRWGYRAPAG